MWPFKKEPEKAPEPVEPDISYGPGFACEDMHLQKIENGLICEECGKNTKRAVLTYENWYNIYAGHHKWIRAFFRWAD